MSFMYIIAIYTCVCHLEQVLNCGYSFNSKICIEINQEYVATG